MTSRLKDKIAVIIGGGSWIGKEIAKKYALEKATVLIAGLTLSKLEETVDEIQNNGGKAICTLLDVRNEQQVAHFFKKTEEQYKKIDILVNSAAIYPNSTIDKLSLDEWRAVIDTNLTGSFMVLKYASEIMKKNSHGKIIFISSVVGETLGISGYSHYGASKAGVNGLMRGAAIELAKFNIHVNSISPGNIVNHQRFNIDTDALSQMRNNIPAGRTGTPVDVANLALFLASDESDFITGQDYIIDGGEVIS